MKHGSLLLGQFKYFEFGKGEIRKAPKGYLKSPWSLHIGTFL
jgi:hypothetical protein